jgi:phage baseplate assembly protein W
MNAPLFPLRGEAAGHAAEGGLRYERLGKGQGLPLAPVDGRMPFASGPEKVRQSIFIILDTEPGERVMLPEFGCGLRRFLMHPNNGATRAQIEREVGLALQQWEPRIKVTQVAVTGADDPALLLVEIQYLHAVDGRRDMLVYPFYLE